jgi:hypothetical protein
MNENQPTEPETMTKARCHVILRQTSKGQTALASVNARNGLDLARHGEARAAIVLALVIAGLQ